MAPTPSTLIPRKKFSYDDVPPTPATEPPLPFSDAAKNHVPNPYMNSKLTHEKIVAVRAKSTIPSGPPKIGMALTGTRGSVYASTLEESNVDLAQEFVSMIMTQRGFQANSRSITTTDSMIEEIVNLKR